MDFAITPRGDLILEEYNEPKSFKLSFRLTEKRGLLVKLFISQQPSIQNDAQFKISFIHKEKTGITHTASLVNDIDMKLQEIRIALTTEREELPKRPNIGSQLHLIKHDNLYDPATLHLVEQAVKESLRTILPDARVLAKPERGIGNFYCQNISIYIYHQNNLIFKFYL